MERFRINEVRVHEISTKLLNAWISKPQAYPYSDPSTQRPQDLEMNKELSKLSELEQSLFWFYSCLYMTGAISSNMAIGKLWELRKQHPECFDPDYMLGLDGYRFDVFVSDLRTFINYTPEQEAEHWVENSHRL